MKLRALACCLACALSAAPRSVIVDTDAGSDDLIAIAFLLARSDLRIEAITIANGLAHVPAGTQTVLRLLALAGRNEIPVYAGRQAPLSGSNAFPESWRRVADEAPGINLPPPARNVEAMSASAFLRQRLRGGQKAVSVLALGPLTNIAEALVGPSANVLAIDDLVIMGGAIRVPGNLPGGGPLYSSNLTAEWNFYIDPKAARTVVQTVSNTRLVPLDACAAVPVTSEFLTATKSTVHSKLGRFTLQVLESNRTLIDERAFYAWDPLAAVALVVPSVLRISSVPIEVVVEGGEQGRTLEVQTARPIRAALSADPILFRKSLFEALR